MGLLLQEFYKHSSLLPLGFGRMAGEAFESGQRRWASGEELLQQIRLLSSQNQQPHPPELQALYFKTVVYIPLEKGAGVLEIGTRELVTECESGMIYKILGFINGLATQETSREDQIVGLGSSFESGTKALPNDAGNQYGDPDDQHKSASMVEIYAGRAIFRHRSTTSSYWSSSSTASSSTPSASDQIGNNSNTPFVLNTSPAQVSSVNNEDMLRSPASSLQATPNSMVNSFDELHILNQVLDPIDMHGVSVPISLPDFDSYGLNNADFTHDPDLHLSNPSLYFSSTNVGSSYPPVSIPDNSQYLHPYSEPNTHHNHLLDYVLQPMQCAFSARNDAHHSLNEIVGGSSKEPTMACQIAVTSLPPLTSQASCHSASYRDYQQQQWTYMNERDRMTDLFGQSERHAHAMVSAVISKIPLAEDSLGDDKRLEANIDHEIMQEQGTALMIEDEGSTSQNRKLIIGYGAFIGDKMANDQGEKMVVSSTVTSTTQAVGSYVSYASGSAEADKVVGSSTRKAGGSYVSYASGSAEADREVGPGSYANYAYGSPEAYKAVGFTNIGTPHESSMNPAQVHHMRAERKRRREQSDCIKTLHTLLPNITKKNKVAILEGTVRYVQQLKDRIRELEQENSALMNVSFEDQRKASEDSSHYVSTSQHATNVENSRQKISSQGNATCDYVEDTMPHFRLSLIKNVQDVQHNATIIDIMNALQKRNLYCFEINSEFWKDTSQLSIKILANYQDAGNYNPTLDEIQHINRWWKHLIKDH